jgi:hypothetical protein
MYEERFYRQHISSKFKIEVTFKESDLLISADKEIDKERARDILKKYYTEIENYIRKNPKFLTSLSPLEEDKEAPPIIRDMIKCSSVTGIGPFSSVAGAIALYVGKEILQFANEVIIENGGDIFLKIKEDKKIGIYLGERSKIETISLKISKRDYSFGIASSSSYIGHSLNFGRVDLVTVVAKDAIIADGFATAFSNRIKKERDIEDVLKLAKNNPLIEGMLISFEDKIFIWGDLEMV